MPRHLQTTACLKTQGPLSKFCGCPHCNLKVCSVCGTYEGSLTTDCPGTKVDFDKQQEIYETNLDYTDERGWHLAQPLPGNQLARRVPRFDVPTYGPPPLASAERADHRAALQHELALKAIAWVRADRDCEDQSAVLVRVEDEAQELRFKIEREGGSIMPEDGALLARLERAQIDFRITDQRAQKCDDEFRQAARRLVDALEDP